MTRTFLRRAKVKVEASVLNGARLAAQGSSASSHRRHATSASRPNQAIRPTPPRGKRPRETSRPLDAPRLQGTTRTHAQRRSPHGTSYMLPMLPQAHRYDTLATRLGERMILAPGRVRLRVHDRRLLDDPTTYRHQCPQGGQQRRLQFATRCTTRLSYLRQRRERRIPSMPAETQECELRRQYNLLTQMSIPTREVTEVYGK